MKVWIEAVWPKWKAVFLYRYYFIGENLAVGRLKEYCLSRAYCDWAHLAKMGAAIG